jgi:hypothetical protein
MRNIEASPWLGKPQLVEIKSATLANRRVYDFSLNASIKRAPAQDVQQMTGAKPVESAKDKK